MDSYDNLSKKENCSSRLLTLFLLIAEILGITCLILLIVWRSLYHGGFHPVSRITELNLHTLLMFISMIFLYANAMLAFRVLRGTKKMYVKLVHAALHVVVVVIASVGLSYAFRFHGDGAHSRGEEEKDADSAFAQRHGDAHSRSHDNHYQMYSLHSWLGIITVILFVAQWFFGFCSFLLPICSLKFRELVRPVHAYLGCFIFAFAVATTITGITQLAYFDLGGRYEWMVPEGILANCFGVILVFFAGCVLFVVASDYFKRETGFELENVSEKTRLTDN